MNLKQWHSNLPNKITTFRVICTPVLWVLALLDYKIAFGILFGLAGLSDALDGYAARKLKQTTKFGSWYDSFADNIISASLVFWIYLLLPEFFKEQLLVIIIPFIAFGLNMLIGFIKYKKMVNYHTYLNKTSAVLVYTFFTHAILFTPNTTFFYITASIAALGETEAIFHTINQQKNP